MKTFVCIALVVVIIVIIFLSIHFFKIDMDNKKYIDMYEEEKNEQNLRIINLEKRMKSNEIALGDLYAEREQNDRKNKKSNRIIKRY